MADDQKTTGDDGKEPSDPKKRVRFLDISSRTFEHPADRAALTTLRKVPGLDLVLRKLVGLIGEKRLRAICMGGSVKVNERQFPALCKIYDECVEILDMPDKPDLFVSQTPFVNAGAVGADNPFMVLNSGSLSLFSEDELRFILGHELGHILSGHVLFKTMLKLLLQLSITRLGIPLSGLAISAIIAALSEWDRKSELSCDRAGLLCLQDPDVAYNVFMRMAGGKTVDQMSLDEFIVQAETYESGGDQLDSLAKILSLSRRSHPFPVLRLAVLKRWVEGEEYQRILSGEYRKRADDADASVAEELSESAKSYKETVADSRDPLLQSLREAGENILGKLSGLFRKDEEEKSGEDSTTPNDTDPTQDV